MRFMVLIFDDPELSKDFTDADWAKMGQAHGAFAGEASQAGVLIDGWPLDRSMGAATVAVRNGETITTDGPFIESKEQLAGYYVLECDSMDDAKAWAAKIPSAQVGTLDIRAIGQLPGG